MNSQSLITAPAVWQVQTPAPAGTRPLRWRPRLRWWLKKLKQYGRLQIDLDLRGVLHLCAVAALALSWTMAPESPQGYPQDMPAQAQSLALASLGAMLSHRAY